LNGRRETAKEMKWSFGFSRCKSFLVCVLQRSSTIKPKAAHYNKLKKSEKKHLQELEGAIDRFGERHIRWAFSFWASQKKTNCRIIFVFVWPCDVTVRRLSLIKNETNGQEKSKEKKKRILSSDWKKWNKFRNIFIVLQFALKISTPLAPSAVIIIDFFFYSL
jgi:hypothetical protein